MLNPPSSPRAFVPMRRAVLAAAAALLAVGAQAQSVQGVTDTEILIGSIIDLSGPVASVGGPQRDGMTLAIEDINAAGGIQGRKLKLLIEDSGFDPKKAVLAAQKLVTQDKVFALIGTLGSAATQASSPIAIDRNVPVLFPMAATDATYTPHGPLKFGLLSLGADSSRVIIKYAHDKLGKRRFGVIYQDDETGLTYLRAAEEQLKVHGLSFVERTSHKRGEMNFAAQVAKLKAANLDAVFLGINPREAAAVTVEARTQGMKVDYFGPAMTVQPVITLSGGAAEGMYGVNAFTGLSQEPSPAYAALLERYKARFGREVIDGVNFGYVSTMLFAEGARNAGRNLTPQALAQGLEKVKNFKTTFETVPISYGPDNHAPPRTALVFQVQGNRWKVIDGPLGY